MVDEIYKTVARRRGWKFSVTRGGFCHPAKDQIVDDEEEACFVDGLETEEDAQEWLARNMEETKV